MIPIGAFSNKLFDTGSIIVVLCVIVFFRYSQRTDLRDNWLKPSNLFLISFLIVNFQFLLDYRLGIKSDFSFYILYPTVLNHCFILAVIGLLAFVGGYIGSFNGDNNLVDYKKPDYSNMIIPLVLIHLVVFAAFVYTIDISSFLTGNDYGSELKTYTHLEKLLTAINALVVVLVVCRYDGNGSFRSFISSFPVLSLIIIVIYMILRLLSGDRGPFVFLAILLFYGYIYISRKKFKLITTIVVLVLGFFIMSLVGIARSLDVTNDFLSRMSSSAEVFSTEGRFSSLDSRTVMPLTEELGLSFLVNQTDVHAIEIEGEPFHPGSYFLISVANGVPFMPGLIGKVFHISYEDFSSTGFANSHFFKDREATWSIGTTIIGDFYLQFSSLGVLIGLFIVGCLMKYLDMFLFVRRQRVDNMYLVFIVLLFASTSIYMPRSLLLGELPRFVIGAIIIFLLSIFYNR